MSKHAYTAEQLVKINLELAKLIETAMNSEDDIDRTYLLEAVIDDLRLGSTNRTEDLIKNPIS